MTVQRLTAAYRSRPRPSSAPGAKASTMCSYYLDGEIPAYSKARRDVSTLLLLLALGAVFKLRRGRHAGFSRARSLKTEQCMRRRHRTTRARGRHRSQTSVDVSGRRARGAPCSLDVIQPPWAGVLELPRKEVIQPQLPLRLPCYDFTPITNPTFGGCLP